MIKRNYFGFLKLAKKTFAVITASLGILTSNESKALPQNSNSKELSSNLNLGKAQQTFLIPKLVLKLNSENNDKLLLAHGSHSSHSSHSSHRSHSSHYSSSPDYRNNPSSDDGSGLGIVGIAVAGAVIYGAYQLGKNKGNKK